MNHAVRLRRAGKVNGRSCGSRGAACGPLVILLASMLFSAWACAPTVTIEAPKEPIEINLNIKIEHEIRVKVDDDLEQLFEEDSELF